MDDLLVDFDDKQCATRRAFVVDSPCQYLNQAMPRLIIVFQAWRKFVNSPSLSMNKQLRLFPTFFVVRLQKTNLTTGQYLTLQCLCSVSVG